MSSSSQTSTPISPTNTPRSVSTPVTEVTESISESVSSTSRDQSISRPASRLTHENISLTIRAKVNNKEKDTESLILFLEKILCLFNQAPRENGILSEEEAGQRLDRFHDELNQHFALNSEALTQYQPYQKELGAMQNALLSMDSSTPTGLLAEVIHEIYITMQKQGVSYLTSFNNQLIDDKVDFFVRGLACNLSMAIETLLKIIQERQGQKESKTTSESSANSKSEPPSNTEEDYKRFARRFSSAQLNSNTLANEQEKKRKEAYEIFPDIKIIIGKTFYHFVYTTLLKNGFALEKNRINKLLQKFYSTEGNIKELINVLGNWKSNNFPLNLDEAIQILRIAASNQPNNLIPLSTNNGQSEATTSSTTISINTNNLKDKSQELLEHIFTNYSQLLSFQQNPQGFRQLASIYHESGIRSPLHHVLKNSPQGEFRSLPKQRVNQLKQFLTSTQRAPRYNTALETKTSTTNIPQQDSKPSIKNSWNNNTSTTSNAIQTQNTSSSTVQPIEVKAENKGNDINTFKEKLLKAHANLKSFDQNLRRILTDFGPNSRPLSMATDLYCNSLMPLFTSLNKDKNLLTAVANDHFMRMQIGSVIEFTLSNIYSCNFRSSDYCEELVNTFVKNWNKLKAEQLNSAAANEQKISTPTPSSNMSTSSTSSPSVSMVTSVIS
jgi:hypothetical protein